MGSLGERLRTAREAKSITFDQASRDTSIAARYIEALETEDFSDFPGEPYIIGFLRNYSVYLDLDVQEVLSLYRAFKIQEQPIPVEQLLRTPPKLPKILITIAVILIILGAGGGVYFLVTRPPKTDAAAPVSRAPVEYTMNSESVERRFYRGDSILVPVEANHYKLELVNVGEAVTIRTPNGTSIFDLGQEASVDLNDDGAADLQITVVDFDKKNADHGVQLRLAAGGGAAAAVSAVDASVSPASVETAGSVNLAGATVIISSPNSYPFTLQSNFQGYCMFRWEILYEPNRRERKEEYFSRGDVFEKQVQNGIRIWVTNAQAAKCQIIGGSRTYAVDLGGAGEIVVAEIRWIRDDDNRYRLVLVRLEAGNS
jgi:cytoskeletal protein RodZ